MSDLHPLFQSFKIADLTLKNRIVMAPLTRCRAGHDDSPTEVNASYYAQRASAGLIISEATQISPQGKGYAHTPGIYTENQIAGWKKVTQSVHQSGGKIFCQLWHVGRISHPDLQPNGALPVAPSAIAAEGMALTETGLKPFVTPRALKTEELGQIVEQYRHAADCAKRAGFDGVELHAANGYLLDQFLRSATNLRQDAYGGSVENRMRLIVEIIDAILQVWPSHRIGIRISPVSTFNQMADENPQKTFEQLIQVLNTKYLAYLHCIEGTARDERPRPDEFDFIKLRQTFNSVYIANNMYQLDSAKQAIDEKTADLICFGRAFIANPDLVHRFANGFPLEEAPKSCWYGGGAPGYTDWPPYHY